MGGGLPACLATCSVGSTRPSEDGESTQGAPRPRGAKLLRLDGAAVGVSVGVSVGVAICVLHCPVLAAAPPRRIGGLGLRAEQQRHEQVQHLHVVAHLCEVGGAASTGLPMDRPEERPAGA